MKARRRKITILLEDDVACFVRLEAQRKGSSVSELIAHFVKERMIENNYEAARRRALARGPFLTTDGKYLSREDAHGRDRLR